MKLHFLVAFIFFTSISFSQDNTMKKELPNFHLFRAEENYSYLKNKEQNEFKQSSFDAIKFISFNKQRSIYGTIGGEIRPRIEHFSNRKWNGEDDETFYSHRLSLHTNFVFGENFRVFGELYNGYTNHNKKIVQDDELALHQAFIEVKFQLKENPNLSFRLGRQEMGLGTTRLVGVREGPNVRRSFDAGRIIFNSGNTTLNAFYAKEVLPNFFAFDNEFTLFNTRASNPKLYGIYSQFKIKNLQGKNELYYLGFETNSSKFSDLSGKEKRHTFGLRRFGNVNKRLSFNTEIMYQFGRLGNANISAFNIGTDTHYRLINSNWKTDFGLKLNWSSGDKNTGDNNVNTFNPMFVNPTFYGLSANIIPINLLSIHPSVHLNPIKKLDILIDWGIFWRASKNDGLYSPPRFLNRNSNGITDRYIGNQFGFKSTFKINHHFILGLNSSYFIAGNFLEKSGTSENIFHISPKISFKF